MHMYFNEIIDKIKRNTIYFLMYIQDIHICPITNQLSLFNIILNVILSTR